MDEERSTTNGIDEQWLRDHPDAGAPAPIDPATGQHRSYWVLSEAERAKGFVRPVRRAYRHVGIAGPDKAMLRDLTAEEAERYSEIGYVKFEAYQPGAHGSATGRFWTQADLDRVGRGCQAVTTMNIAIAETYARNPGYYGATFCSHCMTHYSVGRDGEFVWEGNGGPNIEPERVGT